MVDRKNSFKLWSISLLVLCQFSCNPFNGSSSVFSIRGANIFVTGNFYIQLSSASSKKLNSSSLVFNSEGCEEPLVSIFEIDENGEKSTTSAGSGKIKSDGSYSITLDQLTKEKRVSFTSDSYVAEVSGCNADYIIPLTGTENQNFEEGASLLGFLLNSRQKNAFSRSLKSKKVEIRSLFESLNLATSIEEAFNLLESSAEKKNRFISIFGHDPSILKEVPPKIVKIEILNLTPIENELLTVGVKTQHWYSNYETFLALKVNDEIIEQRAGPDATFSFKFSKNSPELNSVSVLAGRKNSSNEIDRQFNFFYSKINRTFRLSNSFLPTVPTISEIGSLYTSGLNIDIQIATGLNKINCESFSKILFSINSTVVPVETSQNSIDCQTPLNQIKTISLFPLEGMQKIRFWTKDVRGQTSSGFSDLTYIVDQTNPVVTIGSISPHYNGGAIVPISYAATDFYGIDTLKLYRSSDGTNYSFAANLNPVQTVYNWLVPLENSNNFFKIVAVDFAGLQTEAVSASFEIDSIVPSAPSISRISASPTADLNFVIANANCNNMSEYIIFKEVNTTPSNSDVGWQPCSVSNYNFSVSAGDGSRTVYAFLKDRAQNISSHASVVASVDQTAPTLSLFSLNGGYVKGGAPASITWTSSDINIDSNPIRIDYSIDAGSNWVLISNNELNDGTYTWNVPLVDLSDVVLRVSSKDSLNNVATVQSAANFSIDSTSPTITALSINSGAATTLSKFLTVTFSANETQIIGSSQVSEICLKSYRNGDSASSAPIVLTDPCWISLSSAGLAVSNTITSADIQNYLLSAFIPDTFFIVAWVRDQAGNISSTSSSDSINFVPPAPSEILNVNASQTDAMSVPLDASLTGVGNGQNVFIKWKINVGTIALQANPIKIFQSINSITWNEIDPGTLKNNTSNGGCTVTSDYSGCYVWPNSVGVSSFRFRVEVADLNGVFINSVSNWVNASNFRPIIGNTNSGINGSASSAVFPTGIAQSDSSWGNLAISINKTVYYIIPNSGIVEIKPTDGKMNLIIPFSGSSIDGPIGTATLFSKLTALEIDSQNRVIIFESDNNRLRRYDPQNQTVVTLSGGNPISTSNGSLASDFQIRSTLCHQLVRNILYIDALDNVYFATCSSIFLGGFQLAKYQNSDEKIYTTSYTSTEGYTVPISYILSYETALATAGLQVHSFSIKLSVLGALEFVFVGAIQSNPAKGFYLTFDSSGSTVAQVLALKPCNVSPSASSNRYIRATLDGQFVGVHPDANYLARYNIAQPTQWQSIINTTYGYSPDGTTVSPGVKTRITTMAMSKGSQIYFIENGRLRFIDSNNKIQTLYGQSLSYGDGLSPLNARFNTISDVIKKSDGKLILGDYTNGSLREVNFATQTVRKVAGNGEFTFNLVSPFAAINNSYMDGYFRVGMAIDPATNEIYRFQRNNVSQNRLVKLLTTEFWSFIGLGFGSSPTYRSYFEAASEGMDALFINTNGDAVESSVCGFDTVNNRLLVSFRQAKTVTGDNRVNIMQKYINVSTNTFHHFTGALSSLDGLAPYTQNVDSYGFGAAGTAVSTSTGGWCGDTKMFFDAANSALDGGPRWVSVSANRLVGLPVAGGSTIQTVATLPFSVRSYTFVRNVAGHRIYYCSNTTPSILRRFVITNPATGAGVDTILATPPGVNCFYNSNEIFWDQTKDSVIFTYIENGITGVAEFYDP